MIRRMLAAAAICAAMGCAASPGESVPQAKSPTDFAGSWRSVTPSMEFVRLTVVSMSSRIGAMGTRLTFSGVAWEGSGSIEGDSLVASVATTSGGPTRTMIIHARDGQPLQLEMRAGAGATTDLALSFVREN